MAEHMRLNGLSQGYFCYRCGQVTNMYATGHGEGLCTAMPELVKRLIELNTPDPKGIAKPSEKQVPEKERIWLEGWNAAKELVEIDGVKCWAHTVFPEGYEGNPYEGQ